MKTAAEYMRAMRARKKAHPERYKCDCDRKGYVFHCGEIICRVCWKRDFPEKNKKADNRWR